MKNVLTTTCKKNRTEEYIRHEYPINGEFHPFDIQSNLQHFIFAEGYTYLMKEEKLKDNNSILKIIQKAYRPYILCERYLMIYRGDIVWKNNDLKLEENENYILLSLDKEKIDEFNYSNKLNNKNNLDLDIEELKKKSRKCENVYMIAKCL